jgi:uncharacterized protein (DUF2141 family)
MPRLSTIAFAAALAASGSAHAGDLTIHIDDIRAASGSVMVAVYSSADTFLKAPLLATGAPATATGNTIVIKDLPAGEYAFAVYHDANANGKMDKNLLGIPTEDYAFSNNAMGKMGPPSYADARIIVPAEGATVRVSVK